LMQSHGTHVHAGVDCFARPADERRSIHLIYVDRRDLDPCVTSIHAHESKPLPGLASGTRSPPLHLCVHAWSQGAGCKLRPCAAGTQNSGLRPATANQRNPRG
jgi:hypothetical protein